jgi:hypothetical protein
MRISAGIVFRISGRFRFGVLVELEMIVPRSGKDFT